MDNKRGGLTVAQARDHFQTSRRYVLALLEYLDSIGVTTREGDIRRLKRLKASMKTTFSWMLQASISA